MTAVSPAEARPNPQALRMFLDDRLPEGAPMTLTRVIFLSYHIVPKDRVRAALATGNGTEASTAVSPPSQTRLPAQHAPARAAGTATTSAATTLHPRARPPPQAVTATTTSVLTPTTRSLLATGVPRPCPAAWVRKSATSLMV